MRLLVSLSWSLLVSLSLSLSLSLALSLSRARSLSLALALSLCSLSLVQQRERRDALQGQLSQVTCALQALEKEKEAWQLAEGKRDDDRQRDAAVKEGVRA